VGSRCFRVLALLILALLASPGAGAPRAAAAHDRVDAAAVWRALGVSGALRIDGRDLRRDALRRIYAARAFAPIWTADPLGLDRAALVIRSLGAAAIHGLEPDDYHVDGIARRAFVFAEGPAALERELLLTDAVLRYAGDLRAGRVRPGDVERDWAIAPPAFDAVAELLRALDGNAVAAWFRGLAPARPEYAALVEALARHRELAGAGGWPAVPPGERLRPGARDGRVPLLRARLAAAGDLPRDGSDGDRLDAELEGAVRRFQARHGLEVDGIVGPATQRALDVPAETRAAQIAQNLERWRWLPADLGPRHIAVNAAAATLEVVDNGRVRLVSRVVVGDPKHPTPVVQTRVEAVVFHPVWHIPVDIARKEILPRLARNPHVLADNGIVIAGREATDPHGRAVDWATVDPRRWPLALRQRPGPTNPLGAIKLDTPSRFQVYLHDSPARALFARPVRMLSHGCVRVEAVRELAALALEGQPGWGPTGIARAIDAGVTVRVPVAQPLPVYLLYWTAFVDAEGVMQFRDDVYGRDTRLAAALSARAHAAAPREARVGCGE
jgi:murein L,D-transpeptidase YcbB/YkuD